MKKPKISVITITYNSEKTLEETIKSVINQEYDNLEYIIVDGHSTDGTLDIVDKYKDKIDVIISEPDKGISDAFNKGIKLATGELIGIINSDDRLLEGSISYVAKEYDSNYDVFRGNVVTWNEVTNEKLSVKPSMTFPLRRKIKAVCHPGTFIKKDAYNKWGNYQEKLRYMMDADLLHRFYLAGARFKYINKDLALFKLGGATSDKWSKKTREVYAIVVDNGGTRLLAIFKCIKFIIFQSIKGVIFRIIGADNARSHWANVN